MHFRKRMKKFIALAGSTTMLSLAMIPNANADATTDYLAAIKKNTDDILSTINTFFQNSLPYYLSWLKQDDAQSTVDMQGNFAAFGAAIPTNQATQNAQQTQVIADILGISIADLTNPKDKPAVLQTIPQVNTLAYSSLLGLPPSPKGSGSFYDYIKNVAGLNIKHDLPQPTWGGSTDAKEKYTTFYNTVSSIESYNGYILSDLYAEAQNKYPLTTAQANLLTQASNSSWIAQIATEELGKVLRQILMFESQTYILLAQSLQTQKQQLNATVMTNTLLILNAQLAESQLKGRASGVMAP